MTRCNYNVDEIKCRNVATIGERCNEHPIVWTAIIETEPQATELGVLPLSPQQKAAKTKAAKKALLKKEMEELEDD